MLYDEYSQITQRFKKEFGDDVLVLIEVGSFWELYDCDQHLGADMTRASDLINIQVTRKSKAIPEVSRTNPLMAGFPSHALDRFLSSLLSVFTVILVSQVTPPPNPKREVTHIMSKGTYMDAVTTPTNWVGCAFVEKKSAGAAVIDLSTGQSFAIECGGGSSGTLMDDLTKWIGLYKPCELILFGDATSNFPTPPHECRMFNRGNDYDKDILKASYQTVCLKDVMCGDHKHTSPIERTGLEKNWFALAAFVQLVVYCRRHNERITRLIRAPQLATYEDHMYLFRSEDLDLSLVETLLNRCSTSMGRRWFSHRLRHPYKNRRDMEASYEAIERARPLCQATRKKLKDVYDLERLFRKVRLRTLKMNEAAMIATSLEAVYGRSGNELLTTMLASGYDVHEPFASTPAILELRKQRSELEKSQQDIADRLPLAKLERSDRDGTFVTLTLRRYEAVKKDVEREGFRLINSNTNLVKISHPQLDTCERDMKTLEADEKDAMARAFEGALEAMLRHESSFDSIVKEVAELDFATTCALNADEWSYTRPTLIAPASGPHVKVTGIRHPWVERKMDTIPYISNDVELGSMLIYGLNSSGKSTLMKALGLSIIMAQSGMYVPCTKMHLQPFSSLFCRISKGDRIAEGMSTFVVEMSELRTILKKADRDSLVLGDELCAGTEHESAIAIVYAGIKRLQGIGCSFVFATHIHELPGLLTVHGGAGGPLICHLDAYFDTSTGDLVYNRVLLPGSGSASYGIEVCKALGLDSDFIRSATEVIGDRLFAVKKSPYGKDVFSDGQCSVCRAKGDEFHHIVEQRLKRADPHRASNQALLCSRCHNRVHNGEIQIEGYVSTSHGPVLRTAKPPQPDADEDLVHELRNQGLSIDQIFKCLNGQMTKYRLNKILKQKNSI